MHEPPPAEVGGWRVGDPIAEGGFGRVFAATSPAGVSAAIKLMHTHIADDPIHAQRFYSEARIASGLTHPNTVRVFDWGHASNGHLFLVMERLHGHELQEEIDACDYMDPVRGAQFAIQALGALEEAHEAGIVHLDVKPSNLFVCDDDHIKVIDFGIARRIDPDDDMEPLDDVLGTPDYLSPEQARCRAIDGRSDIYAMGLVLYRCVAGQLPFVGGDLMDIAMQRVLAPAPPVQEVSPQPLPPDLSRTIMRALATKPANRWQTARAMSDALVTLVESMRAGATEH
jgi:serine/threonine-protein kinase